MNRKKTGKRIRSFFQLSIWHRLAYALAGCALLWSCVYYAIGFGG